MPSFTVMMALMKKNILKLMRNVTGLLFVFLLPVAEVAFFSVGVGGDLTQLPLAIVNHEKQLTGNSNIFLKGNSFLKLSF